MTAPAQKYTSASTCRNQVPALHRALLRMSIWKEGDINVDIGGGRYDRATLALSDKGVVNVVWDPFNRSDEENRLSWAALQKGATTATVANVLNVIAEPEVRSHVIQLATKAGRAYFSVYEGDRSGVGRRTVFWPVSCPRCASSLATFPSFLSEGPRR